MEILPVSHGIFFNNLTLKIQKIIDNLISEFLLDINRKNSIIFLKIKEKIKYLLNIPFLNRYSKGQS